MRDGLNHSLTIGVIAGTPVDTDFGVSYVQEHGITAYGESISRSPQEQTLLQHLDRDELHKRFNSATDKLKERDVDSVLIYCNSLSCSINIELLRGYAEIPVITPLDIYKEIAPKYSVFGLLAANCNSCAGIEKVILERNEDAKVIGWGDLGIVNDIEKGIPPLDIIASHSISELIHLMAKNGAEIIILACTHLTYIYRDLSLATDVSVPILEPSFLMMQKIVNQSRSQQLLASVA